MSRRAARRSAIGSLVAVLALGAGSIAARSERVEPSVVRRELPAALVAARRALAEGHPGLRGFRAPILERAGEPLSVAVPAFPAGDPRARAAELVARGLAREGLALTLARALEALGPERARAADDAALAELGLPVDWLACFRAPDGGPLAAWTAREVASGRRSEELRAELAAAEFRFAPSRAGFRVACEDGEHAIGALRLQLPGARWWVGPGDGGALDLLRQLCAVVPDADLYVGVEDVHVEPLLAILRGFPLERAGRVVVVASALPMSQWAQDDGKAGLAPGAGGAPEVVTLVPRYASRSEDGARFMPGETFALEDFAHAGQAVVQSPLLFQGGNLLAARDARSGARIAFLGEAEVHRNAALGLTREQVLAAFAAELGVDRVEVLPAASYHVDFEVSLRATPDGLIAFVADVPAAARIVLRRGIDALEKGGALEPAAAERARAAHGEGRLGACLEAIVPVVMKSAVAPGQFPESLTAAFSAGGPDSGPGNFQRFLLAIDVVLAGIVAPDDPNVDPNSSAYFRSLRRVAREREAFARRLGELGLRVVPVPSLPMGELGVGALNGLHEPGRYLMPAWGGFLAPLDQAARDVLEGALGPSVRVVEVGCSETQRRGGGLHCAVAVLPRIAAR